MDGMTYYDWLDFWQIIYWLAVVTGGAWLVVWRILAWDRSWHRQWLALAGYVLLLVPAQGLGGLELNWWQMHDRSLWGPCVVLGYCVGGFSLALLLARHYFRCGWPAAVMLALVASVLAQVACPYMW